MKNLLPGLVALCLTATATASPPPWERTETREDCAGFNTFRNPYFGETHVHTKYSSDAVVAGTRDDPRGAYRFAMGDPIGLPPFDADGNPGRTAQLRRPLDFTAVTDHAEQFGEAVICLSDPDTLTAEELAGYESENCVDLREAIELGQLTETPPPLPQAGVVNFLASYLFPASPQRFDWCGDGGGICLAPASLIWQDTQAAAEELYDRSSACTFTTFVAYEWTGNAGGWNLHRNVIFRNENVTTEAISYLEEFTAKGLWSALDTQCLSADTGCDVLAIPHNPNMSGGFLLEPVNPDGSPYTAADALVNAAMEPLVELTQHKGDSECRPGVDTTDELCAYEKSNKSQNFRFSDPDQEFARLAFVRNILKEGLVQEEGLGTNPFQLGVIGATDGHNANPGFTNEVDFGAGGHIGLRDQNANFILTKFPPGGMEANPGGLAVVWAEENSRDALFAGMRRREAYATSGTRPILRFFALGKSKLECGSADFVEQAYRDGVPMGSRLGPLRGASSPLFAVLATKDPGSDDFEGTPLQRIQIVKGWVDANGEAQEQVFEVAGDPNNGAGVDESTCAATGSGFDSLCAVWEDPDFDRNQRAFYYARVLENPTCRWSTYVCNDLALDCVDLDSVPADFATCCDPLYPKTIQERAWSSPIWYRPEDLAQIKGQIKFGKTTGQDKLKLSLKLGRVPAEFDPNTNDLTVALRDDDLVYSVTIPAGTMQQKGSKFSFKDSSGSLDGLKKVLFKQTGKGEGLLKLQTVGMDLSAADASDHFVETSLQIGTYDLTTQFFWQSSGTKLSIKR